MDTKALRQKILDLAIHGKLVPQDPNDEPASVLLQRIRETKERLIKEGKIKKGKKAAKTSDTALYENVPFEVPESWEWCRVEDICSKFSTGPFGSMVHKSDYVAVDGIPMINPANITDGGISTEKVMLVSKNKAAELERYKLCVEDIILARRGDLSKCAIIKKEQVDFICGTGSFYLHLILMHPSYFKLFYNTSYVKSILETECVGATMNNLNQSVLGHLAIPLPPLAEQRRIVAEIERWFSLIDIIESGKASLQTAVKQAKSKILDLAIHGKLVPQDPTDEPATELLRRINPKAEITSDNAQDGKVPFDVPENWVWTTLGEICLFLSRGKSPKYKDEDRRYPVFAQKCNLKDGGISLEQARFLDPATVEKWGEEYKLKTGDVLINSTGTGTVGRTRLFSESCLGDYPFVVPDSHVSVVRTHNEILSEFVFSYISSSISQQYLEDNLAGSTNQKELYIGVLDDMSFPLPPLAEQHRIVAKIEELFAQLDLIAAEL